MKKFNGSLHTLGCSLAPSEAQQREYDYVTKRLSILLHTHTKSGIKFQLRPAGSFVKRSGIADKMDLDIILLVNNEKPPFKDVLSDFEEILLKKTHLGKQDIIRSPYSLQFSWPCGYDKVEVDLVAAANLVLHPRTGQDTSSEQFKKTLEEIRNYENEDGEPDPFEGRRFYSGTFTEPTIKFVKFQNAAVHELIRLVKFWKNSIYFSKKIFGLSSTLEAMAIFVGARLLGGHRTHFPMLEGLEAFFKEIKDLKRAHIVFSHEKMQGLQCRTFYSDSHVPEEVMRQVPLLLDPVDPYNNRLYGKKFDDGFFSLLSAKAEESLKILAEGRYSCRVGTRCEFALKVVCPGPFDLQPSLDLDSFSLIPLPTGVIIPVTTHQTFDKLSKATMLQESSSRQLNTYASFCLKVFDLVAKSQNKLKLKITRRTPSTFDVLHAIVCHTMKKQGALRNHDNAQEFDVTLLIPCEDGVAMKIHLKWDESHF